MSKDRLGHCQMCGRERQLTFHHLIPRANHKKKWFQKRFEKKEMKERGLYVCKQCHSHIHKLFDEKTLGREYNTLVALMSDERIRKFVNWVKKQR